MRIYTSPDSPHLWLDVKPTPSMLGAYYGMRRHDPHFWESYSDQNPKSVNKSVNRAVCGRWQAYLVMRDQAIVSAHHLHHFAYRGGQGVAWVSGYVPEGFRGRENLALREDAFALFCAYMVRYAGFPHIFCNVLTGNVRAQRWITQECGYTYAGKMLHGIYENGALANFYFYCLNPDDITLCRVEAQKTWPEGKLSKERKHK